MKILPLGSSPGNRTNREDLAVRSSVSPSRNSRQQAQTTEKLETQMKLASLFAMVLLLAVGIARADSKDSNKKKPSKDTLPQADKVEWDVQQFEDFPSFEVVRREVKGNNITWVLENKRALGTEIVFGYQAALFDRDGVKLATIGIVVDPFLMNLPQGERNRFTLNLPPTEKWKDVRKIVIKNGEFR